jgi:cation transport protein ChaC
VAFVANRSGPRYAGRLPVAEVARRIAQGRGPLGTSRDYLESLISQLREGGLRDRGIEAIWRELQRIDG